jgi:hypothetical protein
VLSQASDLWNCRVSAVDGEIGRIYDLQVDDRHWTVSDILVSVGHWLTDRLVIIHPSAVVKTDRSHQKVEVTLTTDQIADAPSVASHPAVSRQHRVAPYHYLGLPLVVGELGPWNPAFAVAGVVERDPAQPRQRDFHLRSLRDLRHYGIEASEAEAGHVEDWLVDVRGWRVSYAVVRIAGGLSRKHVLVPVLRLGPISWGARVIYTDLPRDAIIHAPNYQPGRPPDADSEARLRGWYGSPIRRDEVVRR